MGMYRADETDEHMNDQTFYVVMAWMIPTILLTGFSVRLVMSRRRVRAELESLRRRRGEAKGS